MWPRFGHVASLALPLLYMVLYTSLIWCQGTMAWENVLIFLRKIVAFSSAAISTAIDCIHNGQSAEMLRFSREGWACLG